MEIIKVAVRRSLRKIEFAIGKHFRVRWRWQISLHLFIRHRWKLSQKFKAPFPDRLAHIAVSYICEKYEGTACAKLLALEKHWCPRPEQEKRGHSAIAPGR